MPEPDATAVAPQVSLAMCHVYAAVPAPSSRTISALEVMASMAMANRHVVSVHVRIPAGERRTLGEHRVGARAGRGQLRRHLAHPATPSHTAPAGNGHDYGWVAGGTISAWVMMR